MDSLKQLQDLLRELFQLDMADLDFGIYRLFHLRRDEIEAFLTQQLPGRVEEAFRSVAGEERAVVEKEVSNLTERIKKEIAEDALLEDGEINPEYKDVKAKAMRELLSSYRAKRDQLKSIQASEAQKAEVFNHLYNFFSRYYEAGDFIPRRRYGARETYAVPYNGEETLFHWANKDQHYVKTGETFKDYAFTVEGLGGPFRVRFLLSEASLPPGNTKGDTRYFFPLTDQTNWEEETKSLNIPFHYRLPVEEEVEKYGKNSRFQEGILRNSLSKILDAVSDSSLRSALGATVEEKEGQNISVLFKRMRHFCRRNTSDYFIHRNLEGFLKHELEFYIKDQVLHLADIEGDLESKRRTIRVIRQLAEEIITFLAQIENVQKRLFGKKKFVLQTEYLVPIKEVPHELWKEILGNKSQIEEWKTFFAIDPKKDLFNQKGKVNEQFLKDHPTLVINTSHFESDFKEELLSSFDDIDEDIDGLLMHAEGYQALLFLKQRYQGQVKLVCADPPYNTGSDDFIYKDRYQHSTWLAMMHEYVSRFAQLMSLDGIFASTIDDNELYRLGILLNQVFGERNRAACAPWKSEPSGGKEKTGLRTGHEYVAIYHKGDASSISQHERPTGELNLRDKFGAYRKGRELRKWGGTSSRSDRPNQWFPLPAPDGTSAYPIKNDGTEGHWRWGKINRHIKTALDDPDIFHWEKCPFNPGVTYDGQTERWVPFEKIRATEKAVGWTTWLDYCGANADATRILKQLFGKKPFETPKPNQLYEWIIGLQLDINGIVLDVFGGSGTTAHAVINLNRADSGGRKFILVEMADYFNTVIVPRIQKVMFTPDWKDGKPKRIPTEEEVERTPRLIKILHLEGYEDALHNLTTEETLKREEPRSKAYKEKLGEDTYRVHYVIRLPLELSNSMLNLSALEHPFDYKLEVLTEKGPKVENVDLVETFNYLYGLHVERFETWINDKQKRKYRVVKGRSAEGKRVLVLWRDMDKLDPQMEREFLESKLKSEGPFDEILINGDSATPDIKSLDPIFKRLMEEGEQ
jgi:adenine-specific DNA-methyltransferase